MEPTAKFSILKKCMCVGGMGQRDEGKSLRFGESDAFKSSLCSMLTTHYVTCLRSLTCWGVSLSCCSAPEFFSGVLCNICRRTSHSFISGPLHMFYPEASPTFFFFLSWLLHLNHHFLFVKSWFHPCFSGKTPQGPWLRFTWPMTLRVPGSCSAYKRRSGRDCVRSSLYPRWDSTGQRIRCRQRTGSQSESKFKSLMEQLFTCSCPCVFSFEKSKW